MRDKGSVPGLTRAHEVRSAVGRCAGPLLAVALFSAVINLLGLTGPIYMLQIYDRVLPSHSIPTLVVLTIAMVGLFVIYGLLDIVRLRLLVRIGNRFDRLLQERVFALSVTLPLRNGPDSGRIQPIADLDQIRGFISGSGPTALFDLPWLPVYLLVIYAFHPSLGILATIGAAVSVVLTLIAEIVSRGPGKRASESIQTRRLAAEAARRNAEAVRAMGITERLAAVWANLSDRFLHDQRRVSDAVSASGAITRMWRLILQSGMLGAGAYLALVSEASAGVIIAASIMLARALAPIDILIANWRSLIAARQSYRRLGLLLAAFPAPAERMSLPRPTANLAVEGLSVGAPGQQKPIVQQVSFTLSAGSGLGIIGPSASGKSTLVRALVGAWSPLRGTVRLDGADISQWNPADLGRDVGYLPQDIELFDGTVAENIARFDPDADPSAILAAAEAAGVKEMILRLPEGFETRLGEGGTMVSAGQRQLIGLARALYGNPFLVVLDEPNSNLDADGDAALTSAVAGVRKRGGIVIVVAHRPAALAAVDHILYLLGGAVQAFGPRDEVLARVVRPGPVPDAAPQNPEPQRPPTVVPLHDRRQP